MRIGRFIRNQCTIFIIATIITIAITTMNDTVSITMIVFEARQVPVRPVERIIIRPAGEAGNGQGRRGEGEGEGGEDY